MTIETFAMETSRQDPPYSQSNETLSASGDSTALRLRGLLVVQISGTATAVNAIVLRSPDGAADNFSPAGDPIVGDASAGIAVRRYEEPSRGFWKIRIVSVTGSAKIHLSGFQA